MAAETRGRGPLAFLTSATGWPYLLTPFIPLAIVLELAHADPVLIFFVAAAGIVPTAALMGLATEELAAKSGPGIGGLLNVTFGNAPELIIALIALNAGLQEVVKASIVGSIIGNILLVLGASMLVGGLKHQRQTFNTTAANIQATMLFLAAAALVMPAIFELVEGQGLPSPSAEFVNYDSTVEKLSLATAIVLIGTYLAGLWFSLRTHKDIFNPPYAEEHEEGFGWSIRRSVIYLFVAGIAVGLMSEVLVGSIAETAANAGVTEFFIAVVVVAVVGNAAEHWVAILAAWKDRMDLAVNIAIGSSAQIALFVAPVLVIASFFIGVGPMPLVFNGFELGAILLAILVANVITHDGESNWFEGVQLLALYVILGIAFFYA
jgi:Ca2+:H+ antiporter